VHGVMSPMRWVIAAVAVLAVVALLVWGDRQAGVDDRDTDPEDVEITSDAAPTPLSISIGVE
jgi:hypothetical protein